MQLKKIDLENVRKNRLESHDMRKGIVLSTAAILVLSLFLLYLILYIDPATWWAKPIFFLIIFLNSFYIFSVLFIKRRRGVLAAAVITMALIMKLLGIENIYSFIVLVAIGVVVELVLVIKNR